MVGSWPGRQRWFRGFLLLSLLFSLFEGELAYEIFVSPHGHDIHGDGSDVRPFQSVQAAVDSAWEHDVIVLMSGIHSSDKEIRMYGKRLAIRTQNPPVTRSGGCWPVHTGDPIQPTLTRCNISSWPQAWNLSAHNDEHAFDTPAMSLQTWPSSFVDEGRNLSTFHGSSKAPIPSSEGGDYWVPGDAPRGNPDDFTCESLGCNPRFHGSGNLQAGINSDATLVGARFVFLDGDEVILRDLDIRGSLDGGGEARAWDAADEGGCLFVSGNANITIVDTSFAFCRALGGGGGVAVGYQSNVWFRGVRFLNNSASRGGAVFASMEGDVLFHSCEFSGNSADSGGAVYASDVASPRFESCDFFSNRASTGGALLATGDAKISLTDTALFHNSAGEGGAVAAIEAGRLELRSCTLQNNTAVKRGGAAFTEQSTALNVSDCVFLFNSAPAGGAVFTYAPPHLTHLGLSLFAYNSATKEGGHVHPFALAATLSGDGGNTVCSGRGTVQEGHGLWCKCGDGAVGKNEECAVRCPGAGQGGLGACSGHGVCSADTSQRDRRCRWLPGRRWVCLDEVVGQCQCDFGFMGQDCSMQCPGYLVPDDGKLVRRGVCSGHGECVAMNGTAGCDCEFGWAGAGCDELRLYALACGGGEGAEDNRIVRLGDRVLVNSREPGLHLLALNRSDLTVVWDRSYDVSSIFRDWHRSTAAPFFPDADIDGTVNVFEGRAGDGATGSLSAGEGGELTRNPHVSELFFGEQEANRMARDLSLLDAMHLVVVTSFHSWENRTNRALVQALQRVGGPDLLSFARGKMGSGHSLVIVGVPDGAEQLEDPGGLFQGSFLLGPTPNASAGTRQCLAEVEVNLRRRAERASVRWCGQRLIRGGVDVSHLDGTRCEDDAGPDISSAAVPACAGANCSNGTGSNTTTASNPSADNATTSSAEACDAARLALLCNASNASACLNGSASNASECLCIQDLLLVCNSGGPRAHRWVVVPRTSPERHHPHGQQMEGWDLDGDFDVSEGPGPVLVSNKTILQPCCNRTERWRHGGCRKGRSVSPDPADRSRLVCFESGWGGGGGFGGLFGNLDVAGSRWHTLQAHSPPRDQLPGGPRFGSYTPYLPDPGNRLRPFSQADIVPVREDAARSYGQEGFYGETRSRATPTPVFKACEAGIGECVPGRGGGLVVDGECALGQCGRSTGEREQERWEQEV